MRNLARVLLGRITAAAFLGVGAFFLVATFLPLLNPMLFGFVYDEDGLVSHEVLSSMIGEGHYPYFYYAIGTICSLLLLVVSWIINIRVIKLGERAAGMHTISQYWLIAAAACAILSAHAGEQVRIFNLKELEPRVVSVAGKRVFLSVTGQSPHILMFTNLAPTPLKRRDQADSRKIQVTYGKDLVGFAEVLVSRPTTKAPVTSGSLTFETAEQATAAGKALRLRDTTPTPLRKESQGR